jgi:hypothetical protein
MTPLATSRPDLELAFRRLCSDHPLRAPCPDQLSLDIVYEHSRDWLDDIGRQLNSGTFVPDWAPTFDIAKPAWQSRPMVRLSLRDQLVYHYLGLRLARLIAPKLTWSEKSIRFSYYIRTDGPQWFAERGNFRGWINFDKVSVQNLTDASSHVVSTDLAAYYENIDLGQLSKDLRADGAEPEVVSVLSACLNKWAGARARGIPQSYAPSHLFGEYYLNDLDGGLAAEGITHLRYLDDVRIFARSEPAARKALQRINQLIRSRGLNLQSAKTEILLAADGRNKFAHVHRTLNGVAADMARKIASLATDGYATAQDVATYTKEVDPSEPTPAVIESTWEQFANGKLGEFDKTVFHYLLSRLADLKSQLAAGYVVNVIRDRPEETDVCLRHLAALPVLDAAIPNELARILTAPETLYEHQRWQLLRWFNLKRILSEGVLAFARQHVGLRSVFPLLRSQAILYLGGHAAGRHDFDRIRHALHEETDESVKASLIAALAEGPKDVYASDLSRAQGESSFIDWAVQHAKNRAEDSRSEQRAE